MDITTTSLGEVQRQLPGSAAAVGVGESAVQQVLAAATGSDRGAVTAALLRNVEAQIRAIAPPGMSSADLTEAAARLVERQGLTARVPSSSGLANDDRLPPTASEPAAVVNTQL